MRHLIEELNADRLVIASDDHDHSEALDWYETLHCDSGWVWDSTDHDRQGSHHVFTREDDDATEE